MQKTRWKNKLKLLIIENTKGNKDSSKVLRMSSKINRKCEKQRNTIEREKMRRIQEETVNYTA